MPDVCRQNPKVVEWEGRVFGEDAGRRLERCTSPHYAAVAAVIRLHHVHGKGSLTVREHGPAIRQAVKASDQQAISDYQDIQLKRDREVAQPSTPEPMAPITAQDDTRDGDRLRHLTAEQTNTERGST